MVCSTLICLGEFKPRLDHADSAFYADRVREHKVLEIRWNQHRRFALLLDISLPGSLTFTLLDGQGNLSNESFHGLLVKGLLRTPDVKQLKKLLLVKMSHVRRYLDKALSSNFAQSLQDEKVTVYSGSLADLDDLISEVDVGQLLF